MLTVSVKVDIAGALKKLEDLKGQTAFATALALTRTAQAVKTDLAEAMRTVFAHPRQFTLKSLAITRATKQNLTASVYIRSKGVDNALKAEIKGGRRDRAIEKVLGSVLPAGMFAVPGWDAKRGSDGKVSIAWINSILGKLGTARYSNANARGRRRYASSNSGYFLLTQRNGRLPPGIYQRSGREVLSLIVFVKQPSYTAKFDFDGIAKGSVERHFPEEFEKSAKQALASAR